MNNLLSIINNLHNCVNTNINIRQHNKSRIIKKIDIINNFYNNGLILYDFFNYNENILNTTINELNKSINHLNNKNSVIINDILSFIINNCINKLYFNVVLSNVPEYGISNANNISELIDCVAIYDTIENLIGKNSVIQVYKATTENANSVTYLIRMVSYDMADALCNLLNGNYICKNKLIASIITKNENVKLFNHRLFSKSFIKNNFKSIINDDISNTNDSSSEMIDTDSIMIDTTRDMIDNNKLSNSYFKFIPYSCYMILLSYFLFLYIN